jgi:hypothetical protein
MFYFDADLFVFLFSCFSSRFTISIAVLQLLCIVGSMAIPFSGHIICSRNPLDPSHKRLSLDWRWDMQVSSRGKRYLVVLSNSSCTRCPDTRQF